MKRIIGMALILAVMAGCASVECGPMKARTLGADANIKSGTWTKITSNEVEIIAFEGYRRDEGKSTRSALDLIGVIAGGLLGSPGGPATAAGGALIGGSTAEMLQRAIDALNGKPAPAPAVVTPEPAPPTAPVTGALCDPPAEFMAKVQSDPDGEECRIEPATGLQVRYLVWIPSKRTWWGMSSLGIGHVRKVGGDLVADVFPAPGVTVIPRGFRYGKEPESYSDPSPRLDVVGSKCPYTGERVYIMVDCVR